MTVAKSQEFKIAIYSSPNLKNWTHESDFTKEGYLGFQYECPGLSRFSMPESSNGSYPTDSTDGTKWALFISINPGSPQGGSSTEYFIGDFNGTHFVPDFPYTNVIDLGKDFYALQNFYNSPDGEVYGIGWASNWMYANFAPTDPWRSSTSLVRKFTLEELQANPESKLLNIKSTPVIDYNALNFGETFRYQNETFDTNNSLSYDLSKNFDGLVEFNLTYTVNGSAFGNTDFADLSLYLIGNSDSSEYLRLGFVANAGAFYIDRGNSNVDFVNENPLFTTRMSVSNLPYRNIDSEVSEYKVYGIADRNILELYFNDGSQVSTNTYFFTGGNFITEVDLEVGTDGVYQIEEFQVRQMSLKL